MKAEIYTKTNCPYCTKAKSLFQIKGIEYVEYMISPGFNEGPIGDNQQYVTKEQLLERAPHARTVPQIWLDGEYVGGYTELEKYFNKN
jgi:glutaredoxin